MKKSAIFDFLFQSVEIATFAKEPQLWDDMDPYFTDLMKEAEFANMSWEEQEKYIAAMKQKWDYQNTLDFAEMKGREEGREEERQENARNLKTLGVEPSIIAQATGLTEEQVRAL